MSMITIDARIMYAAYADECNKQQKIPMSYKEFCEVVKSEGYQNVVYPDFDAEDRLS